MCASMVIDEETILYTHYICVQTFKRQLITKIFSHHDKGFRLKLIFFWANYTLTKLEKKWDTQFFNLIAEET